MRSSLATARRGRPVWAWVAAALTAIMSLVAFVPAVGGAAAAIATADPAALRSLVVAVGPLAPLVAILVNVAQAVLAPIPGAAIVYLNGAVFGVWGGAIINLVGGVAGAAACFAIARGALRPRVAHWFQERRMPAVLQGLLRDAPPGATNTRDGLAIAAVRFVPGAPFDLVSYAAGLTRIGWWPFLWGTAAGNAPHAVAYAVLGATLHVPLWIGIGATVALGAVIAVIGRLTVRARRALVRPAAAPSPAVV